MIKIAQLSYEIIPRNKKADAAVNYAYKNTLGVIAWDILGHPEHVPAHIEGLLPPHIDYNTHKVIIFTISENKVLDQITIIRNIVINHIITTLPPHPAKTLKKHIRLYLFSQYVRMSIKDGAHFNNVSNGAYRYGVKMITQDLEINDKLRAPIINEIIKKVNKAWHTPQETKAQNPG